MIKLKVGFQMLGAKPEKTIAAPKVNFQFLLTTPAGLPGPDETIGVCAPQFSSTHQETVRVTVGVCFGPVPAGPETRQATAIRRVRR